MTETKNVEVAEKKSFAAGASYSFADHLFNQGCYDLGAYAAIQMYRDTMPFFHAVDKRATSFAAIPPRLWDKKKEEYVDDHPVLELLAKPNADVTQFEFLYALASYYDITGNAFLTATGRIGRPPLELINVSPLWITFSSSTRFSMLTVPDTITVQTMNLGSTLYHSKEEKSGIRFINDKKDKELWHSRQFNPLKSTTSFWGMSKARPIWLEMQQYLAGNTNNWSLLKRGTRLSLAWVNNRGEELTEKQWDRIQSEAQKYSGSENAGGTPVLDGMDVKPVQVSNIDMQFKDLQEQVVQRISMIYGIPLAFMSNKAMTFNNLETSELQLYDNAIIPLATSLYSELTEFLLPRYPDSENLEFKINEFDVTALRVRVIDNTKRQADIQVNTIDELRTMLGDEALPEGGDAVYRPSTMQPIGEDDIVDVDDPQPEPDAENVADQLRSMKNLDGSRRYSDKTIIAVIKERGLA